MQPHPFFKKNRISRRQLTINIPRSRILEPRQPMRLGLSPNNIIGGVVSLHKLATALAQ